eukprot:Tamp_28423.p1 GENE.Tamp_28423~~Tamp_28423.p1  ORF type:complete len:194 (-),score=26.48 Tamp_28423:14-595(-)
MEEMAPFIWSELLHLKEKERSLGDFSNRGRDQGLRWFTAYRQESQDRERVRAQGLNPGSPFHTSIFGACGKLPAQPDAALLSRLLASRQFCGKADAYQDLNGSTLLMYCVGPVNSDTQEVVRQLKACGANAAHRNRKGQSALGYARAWRNVFNQVAGAAQHYPTPTGDVDAAYVEVIEALLRDGCDPDEAPAF